MEKIINFFRPTVGTANLETRELWLERTINAIPKGFKILDAGAGTQQYRKFCKHLTYYSQDFGKYDGKGNSVGLHTGEFNYGSLDIVSDITSIPKPDAYFDAILCVEVLEHLQNPRKAIVEFSRLLKPKGYLILTAPFCSATHFAPYHYSTGFNRYWYEKHLTENNFTINEIVANGNFFEFIAQEIYRIPYMSLRYSNCKPRLIELFFLFMILRMLHRFSKKDKNSAEFLNFGYQVLAQKR